MAEAKVMACPQCNSLNLEIDENYEDGAKMRCYGCGLNWWRPFYEISLMGIGTNV